MPLGGGSPVRIPRHVLMQELGPTTRRPSLRRSARSLRRLLRRSAHSAAKRGGEGRLGGAFSGGSSVVWEVPSRASSTLCLPHAPRCAPEMPSARPSSWRSCRHHDPSPTRVLTTSRARWPAVHRRERRSTRPRCIPGCTMGWRRPSNTTVRFARTQAIHSRRATLPPRRRRLSQSCVPGHRRARRRLVSQTTRLEGSGSIECTVRQGRCPPGRRILPLCSGLIAARCCELQHTEAEATWTRQA